MGCLDLGTLRNDTVVHPRVTLLSSIYSVQALQKPPSQSHQRAQTKKLRGKPVLLSKGSGTFENTLAKWQTPVERCPLYLLPPGWVEAGRQPSPLTPQGGVSRAEQEANLLSRARQKRASLLPPDGVGRSKWDSLPSGTKSAGVVSAGPSVDLSLCLHPAAMNLKEVVQARTSRPSTFPWAQRDPVGSWASTGSDSVATRQN